jgi:nucleotide-binding universal stress UspA family protein
LEIAEQDAAAYVGGLRNSVTVGGVEVSSSVGRGDPLTALLEMARTVETDLVVMATHARGAMEGFWAGSLTPKLMQRLDRPILLVRAEGHDEAR